MKSPDVIKELVDISSRLATTDGMIPTNIPFVTIIRRSHTTQIARGILQPSFCIVVQGKKRALIGKDIIQYGVGEYMFASVDIPSAGQILKATEATPYYGIKFEFDPKELASIILEAGIKFKEKKSDVPGAFIGKSDLDLQNALLRLMQLADGPQNIYMAGLIKKEILFRLLAGPYGHVLYQNASLANYELGLGKAVQWIKDNFTQTIEVEHLAKLTNMSVSSLQHKFKDLTTMGLLQYQKQLRLQEARRLLLSGESDAATAAFTVGYESPSQFSREYRRLFGAPPMQDIELLKSAPGESLTPE